MATGLPGALVKSNPALRSVNYPAVQLFRTALRELPRVLNIYDMDMSEQDARKGVRALFQKNAAVSDHLVADVLISKGYMELEESLMQYKQATHLHHMLMPGIEESRKPKKPTQQFFASDETPSQKLQREWAQSKQAELSKKLSATFAAAGATPTLEVDEEAFVSPPAEDEDPALMHDIEEFNASFLGSSAKPR